MPGLFVMIMLIMFIKLNYMFMYLWPDRWQYRVISGPIIRPGAGPGHASKLIQRMLIPARYQVRAWRINSNPFIETNNTEYNKKIESPTIFILFNHSSLISLHQGLCCVMRSLLSRNLASLLPMMDVMMSVWCHPSLPRDHDPPAALFVYLEFN